MRRDHIVGIGNKRERDSNTPQQQARKKSGSERASNVALRSNMPTTGYSRRETSFADCVHTAPPDLNERLVTEPRPGVFAALREPDVFARVRVACIAFLPIAP
jgi:hypothetical protein